MSLGKLNDKDRIFFLQDFVEELIINSTKDWELKNLIESEIIKRKYLDEEKPFENFGKTVVFKDEEYEKIDYEKLNPNKEPLQQFKDESIEDKPLDLEKYKQELKLKKSFRDLYKPRKFFNIYNKPKISKNKISYISSYNPVFSTGIESTSKQTDHVLQKTNYVTKEPISKIDFLLKDPGVQLIECPGTGINVIVKSRNQIYNTKVILSEEEIKKIIEYFSVQAKIPIIGGLLKAAVGNIIISAISSDYAGSRFIINKNSPYNILQQ